MKFFTVLTLAALALATPLKRTVAQVEADIAQISSQVNALDSSINAFPNSGGTLAQALAIHNSATTLVTTIQKGTTDVNATPQPSEADSQTILNSVQAIVPAITSGLQAIVAKKPAFDALPLGGVSALVKQDLANLATATTGFENGLIAKAPADLKSQAQNIANTVNAALASAQAAYASA
ncbi:hypothetical protein V5O48_004209 [Marasmius crinis-equi]|uniref:Hydrophobic surface binding protein n=1 Tax=Marasmius crinis-equi TaxID=585013 RepID=A0ABR3FR86_9AGAR